MLYNWQFTWTNSKWTISCVASFMNEYVEYFALKPLTQMYWHEHQWLEMNNIF